MRLLIALLGAAGLNAQQPDYSQIKNSPVVTDKTFQFTLKSGNLTSGSLSTSGAKVLTIRPCPLGIAGANSSHYLRISGGVGTAESVLMGMQITAVTNASPAVVTTALPHGLTTGAFVRPFGFTGSWAAFNTSSEVTVLSSTTYSVAIDTTLFGSIAGTPRIPYGTCTSGASSGTIALTTANTHTGSWSITSDSAGIQEAAKYLEGLGTGGEIRLSFGNSTIYNTITLTGSPFVTISGCGIWCSTIILDASNTSSDLFYCSSATCLMYIRDMTLAASAGHTAGSAIHIKDNSAGRPKIENVRAVDTAGGFRIDNSDYVQVLNSYYDQDTNTNAVYGIRIEGISSDVQIKGGRYAAPEVNVSTMLDYGLWILGGDGVTVDGVMFRGNIGINIAPAYGTGNLLLGSIFITGGTIIDRCRTKGISIVSTGTLTGSDFFGELYFSNSHIAGLPAMETDDLVYIDLTSMGTNYAGISFVGMKINNSNRHGIYAANANGLNISASRIVNNDVANGGASAIRIAGATSLSITGNTLSDFLAVPKQDYGINLSDTVSVVDISGNTAFGNTTAPYNNGASLASAVMSANQGSDDLIGAVTAAATVTLPSSVPKTIGIAGTTTIDTINGFIGSGDTRTFLCPSGLSFSAAGNIKAALGPTTANQVVRCVYNAGDTKWYCN